MRRSKISQIREQASRQIRGVPPSIDDTQDDEEFDPPSEYDDDEGALSPSEEEESLWSQKTKNESSRASKKVTKKNTISQSTSPVIEEGSEIAEETDGEEEDPLEEESEEPEVPEFAVETFDTAIKNSAEEIIVVPDKYRRTSHMMSLSEYTEAISIRTEQIATDGVASVMLDQIPPYLTTARDIAIAEMHARRCPLKLSRNVGRIVEGGVVKNFVEIWSPNVMTHPLFQ